jgi:hypothetical protein
MSNADKATKASTVNRAPGREENSFDIVDLPFGIAITAIVLATPLRGSDLPEAVSESLNLSSHGIGRDAYPNVPPQIICENRPRARKIFWVH